MKTRDRKGPVFIVFEGLDGSGKSTCAKWVADELGAEFMTTPSLEMRAYREDIITSFAGCQEACQLFYLATVFAASARAGELLSGGRSVVLDRYFLSTQAYAAFRGSTLDLDTIARQLLPADITVILDVPLSTRRARVSKRGATVADRETMSPEADAALLRTHAERFGLPVVGRLLRLDGDRLSPGEVVSRVLDAAGRGRSARTPAWGG